MKKAILLLPTAIFPYCLLITTYFQLSIELQLLLPAAVWLLALFCTALFVVLSFRRSWDARELAKINLLIKAIQIPAYVMIFLVGVFGFFFVFLFSAPVLFILVVYDIMSIFLSGMIGLTAILQGCHTGVYPRPHAPLHCVLQFIFCLDVVSAFLVYRKLPAQPHPL